MGDEEKVTKAARGQEIKEYTALDRSSAGIKGQSAIGFAEGTFKGGIENLGHSIKGVSAVQENNGGVKGRKDTVKYPSAD